jgi:hypothetical protein
MNIHVPQQIIDKYPNMEFRGKPYAKDGRTVIRAENHSTGQSFWYSLEEDFFWFTDCEMPKWLIKK